MLKFYFIRHAESEGNLKTDIIGGQSNHLNITAQGQQQANALSQRLAAMFPTTDLLHCWASTAVRTFQTAQIALQHLPVDTNALQRSEQLLELSQGDWVGRARLEIYTPEVVQFINNNNWNFKAPNGESQRDVEERMYAWLESQRDQAPDGSTFLVFTHGVAIKCLLRKILDSTPAMTYKFRIDNTSLTQFNWTERGWTLERVNDTAHLYN